MMQLRQIPSTGVSSFVSRLAKEHGVSFERTGLDALADVITGLSDDEVVTDDTQDLIVALRRADVIDGSTMISLLGNHLDERRGV